MPADMLYIGHFCFLWVVLRVVSTMHLHKGDGKTSYASRLCILYDCVGAYRERERDREREIYIHMRHARSE